MKKILSMLLVLCMALTLCSAAFAEGKSPVDGMTVAFIPKVSGNSFFEAANDGAQKLRTRASMSAPGILTSLRTLVR